MNYYEILKVSQKATDSEIKSSYKALVKKYHPDLYVGDKNFAEQKIKEINEAYDILSNPETKKEYDEYLNPTPQPTASYETAYTDYDKQNYAENNSNIQEEVPQPIWSFTRFITNKFNTLDQKKQLQVFVLILVSVLALFLINLIQVKYYLKNESNSSSTSQNDSNKENNIYTNEDYEDNTLSDDIFDDSYNQNGFEDFEDLFYNLFETYEEDYLNSNDFTYNNFI